MIHILHYKPKIICHIWWSKIYILFTKVGSPTGFCTGSYIIQYFYQWREWGTEMWISNVCRRYQNIKGNRLDNEEQELQTDLWCRKNKMVLNIEKCHFMEFSDRYWQNASWYYINDIELVKVEQIRDLRVTSDNKLKFDSHIDNVINKAFQMLSVVSRLTKDFNQIVYKCSTIR